MRVSAATCKMITAVCTGIVKSAVLKVVSSEIPSNIPGTDHRDNNVEIFIMTPGLHQK